MRDPLLVFIKKEDVEEIPKLDVDEVEKEVVADDDRSLESSQCLREVSPNISGLNTSRPAISSFTKTTNIRRATKRKIESTKNNEGLNVPKENFVNLTPEKDRSIHGDTSYAPHPKNTEIIESDRYLIITLKASHRRKIIRRRTSAKRVSSKASEIPEDIPKVKFENVAKLLKTIPIQQNKTSETSSSVKPPDAIPSTVLPILLHGASKTTVMFDSIPNEDFYAELRDFKETTKWYKKIKSRKRSITTIPYPKKCLDLYPVKFATFLIRVDGSMPKTGLLKECEASSLGNTISINKTIKTESDVALETSTVEIKPQEPLISKCDERLIKSPERIVAKIPLDMITSIDAELPHYPSQEHSSETKHLDPFTVNPIKFRKELHALCRSKSAEPIMVPKKRSEHLTKYGAIPKSSASPKVKKVLESSPEQESGAVPKTRIPNRKREELDIDPGNLPEIGDLKTGFKVSSPSTGDLLSSGDVPSIRDQPSTTALPETFNVPKTRTGPKIRSKSKQATEKSFQFHDVPVVAYVNRSNIQRKTKLKEHLKNKDYLGYYWKKFKHYKRYESERQQILLEKITFTVPQVDAAMFAAQMLTFKIEILRQENCETEESLKIRNSRMRWLMCRLVNKTTKINSLLESIRYNVVLYTLEANSSNSAGNKRLDKIFKFFCEAEEFTRKSVGEHGSTEEVLL